MVKAKSSQATVIDIWPEHSSLLEHSTITSTQLHSQVCREKQKTKLLSLFLT